MINKKNAIKNVFVLCTGRCGSVTFYEACKEIKNYSCAHESKVQELGERRVDFPDFHIEIDNRLSWVLGRLDRRYGSTPLYIHLYRSEEEVAESYNKRWFHRGSIVRAYARGILNRNDQSIEISRDMVQCQLENIESFLSGKKNIIKIDISAPTEGFTSLWNTLGAEGNLSSALELLKVAKNTSKQHQPYASKASPTQEIDHLESLEETITTLQHDNKMQNKKLLDSHQDSRKKEATITSLKQVNSQQKVRIERLINAKSYRAIAAVKKNIKHPLKWPFLSVEFFNILTERNRNSLLGAAIGKDTFLESSKLDNISDAEDYLAKNGSPSDLTALNLLRANKRIDSESEWVTHTNKYITSFGLKPIAVTSGSQSLFERLSATEYEFIDGGPRISVIMPAFNSERTLRLAADSILMQSWKNLELIIIDDCSTDKTKEIAEELVRSDSRVTLLNNTVNVGPYVSKNRGVDVATGEYITGHDADDWALPQRIETQYLAIVNNKAKACACAMLRVEETGKFVRFGNISNSSYDGALRLASISTMFCTTFFSQRIGYRDCVRYAADSEVINRASLILGDSGFLKLWIPGMLCLESSNSLTNNPATGVSPTSGLSPIRVSYRESWENWHKAITPSFKCHLDFPQEQRRFEAPAEMMVSDSDVKKLLIPRT